MGRRRRSHGCTGSSGSGARRARAPQGTPGSERDDPSMTYIVGVDSGGTHTNIRISAPDLADQNVELDRALGGNRSDRELREVFAELLAMVGSRVRGGDLYMWINAAGYAVSTRLQFEAIARD